MKYKYSDIIANWTYKFSQYCIRVGFLESQVILRYSSTQILSISSYLNQVLCNLAYKIFTQTHDLIIYLVNKTIVG